MTGLIFAVRLIHVVAGVGWLGEVMTVNFVVFPALVRAQTEARTFVLQTMFPFVFRLATFLGGAAVVSGLVLILWYTRLDPSLLFGSPRGWLILGGGALGAALYAFHLVQESGAERTLAARLAVAAQTKDTKEESHLLNSLVMFPRVGMVVLILIVGLMVAAAHYPF